MLRREPDSVLFECDITSSGEMPAEQNVARVLDGRWNRFLIIYAVRAPLRMTPGRKAEWTAKLSDTRVFVH